MKMAAKVIFLFALGLTVAACEDDSANYLEGSITDSHDMGFKSARVRLYESEGSDSISIEYLTGANDDVTLRVTYTIFDGQIVAGTEYDLTEDGSIDRGAGLSSLPELESGTLEFSQFSSQNGSDVVGEFDSIFVTSDGSRKTLRGGFSAKLEVVSL